MEADIRAVVIGMEDARFDFPDAPEHDLLAEVIANVAKGHRGRTGFLRRTFGLDGLEPLTDRRT
jgi:hypothetical protein